MRKIFWFLMIVIVVALTVRDYTILMDAYGSGPPYYGRTTNMDKWTNPWPQLMVINVLGIAVLGFLAHRLQALTLHNRHKRR